MGTEQNLKFDIHRSALFVVSYQLEGICQGLRMTVPQGLSPGKDTIAIMHKLFADVSKYTKGITQVFPDISEKSNPVDILVFAETLRTSVLAFLSPDELVEHRKTIGFET